jgi:hypothetical protein
MPSPACWRGGLLPHRPPAVHYSPDTGCDPSGEGRPHT